MHVWYLGMPRRIHNMARYDRIGWMIEAYSRGHSCGWVWVSLVERKIWCGRDRTR